MYQTKNIFPALLALLLAVPVAGCRSGGSDGDDGDDGGDAPSVDGGTNPGGDNTVFEVQADAMPVGTVVNLKGVVVTSIDTYGGRKGAVTVQEPEGGPFSGVVVNTAGTTLAAGLALGDVVDVLGGVKDEFALQEDETGRKVTQVSQPQGGSITINKISAGTVPAPQVVIPWQLAASDAEAEKWEGVLIAFDNVRVHSAPFNVSGSDDTLKEMEVTGPFRVSSSLTELGASNTKGTCYSKVVGIGDYFFGYKVLPRSASDLVAGADGDCLAAEEGDTLCGNTTDDDYNGFSDCEDRACLTAAAACPTEDATVVELQNGDIPADTLVNLTGVRVSAIDSRDKRAFYIQDGTAAGEHNGIFVYQSEGAPELTFGIGATLDLIATVVEDKCYMDNCASNTVTQLVGVYITDTTSGTDDLVPYDGADYATLATDPDAEPYEGVLVTVENIKVVNPDLMYGYATFGDATTPLMIDDTLYQWWKEFEDAPLTADQCLSSITGVMHRNTYDGTPTLLLPRRAGDIDATPGTCD